MIAIGFTFQAHLMSAVLAADFPVSPTIAQIVGASIEVKDAPDGAYSFGDKCAITVKDKKIVGNKGCDALWGVLLADDSKAPANLVAEKQPDKLVISFEKLTWTSTLKPPVEGKFADAAVKEVYHKLDTGTWVEKKATDGKYDITGGGTLLVRTTDEKLHKVTMSSAPAVPDKPATSTGETNAKVLPIKIADTEALKACREAIGFAESRSLCLVIDPTLHASILHLPSRFRDLVLAPNTSLEVFIVHDSRTPITGQLGGDPGLYEPATRRYEVAAGSATDGGTAEREDEEPLPPPVVRRMSFAPRLPSSAVPLTITAKNGPDTVATKFEFVVEKTYSGALRLGIAGLVGSAVDIDYSAVKLGNAMQSEIVAKSDSHIEFEFVAGYSPYIFDMMRGKKGRRYHNTTLRDRSYGFAPYIGLGVLNVARASDVEFFRSVHLGLEWEPVPNFSIAVTAVARRVTRLQDGLSVGSPLAGTDVPTRERIAFGVGIILNLTPEFFRFATREAGGIIRP